MTIGDESEEIETKSATNYCSTVDGTNSDEDDG